MTINNILIKLICLVCFISNISQLPILLNNGIIKLIVISCWAMIMVIASVISVIKKEKISKKELNIFIWVLIFDLFILICEGLTHKQYIASSLVYPIHICAFIYLIGLLISKKCSEKDIRSIFNSYIISSCIVGIYIFINFFIGTNWREGAYVYSSKNSISQILLSAIIFIALYWDNKKLKLVVMTAIFILICMLKSRATIFGAIIAFIFYLFFIEENKKTKKICMCVAVISIAIILTNEYIYDVIINNILLNNKSGSDLNDISSGRLDHLSFFLTNFKEDYFIGQGNVWVESFPLNTLLNYGILGSIPVFVIWLIPLNFLKRKNYRDKKLYNSLSLIYVVYMINSIFEALAPFGPGVKCYMLWLICGIYAGITRNNDKKAIQQNQMK